MKIKWETAPENIMWNKVKALRKKYGLRQAEVAQGADIAISTLWLIEQGFDKKTTKETKDKLAKFFECDVDDIFPAEMVGNQTREEYFKNKQSQKD